ncbi:MAG: plasmid pRiA4b ORF-3 family protein [Spirochaetes bacterium]|nr:plasmid pRiA4b ORF-3 family protein [Spirochaetota bacterium]
MSEKIVKNSKKQNRKSVTCNTIYQFKITLNDITPPIWRRIQVPDTYTFWDLHVAIQDAMGWLDCHLHEFYLRDNDSGRKYSIGMPGEETPPELLDDHEEKIKDHVTQEGQKIEYIYDFGDDWEHEIELEKILAKEDGKTYPNCPDGARACPPEDVGSVPGYEELLEVLKDPQHEEYQEFIDWLGGKFDPEQFDPRKVEFDDPEWRWKQAMDLE